MPVTKILCPIDFSAGSRQAMRVAERLAEDRGAELVLVHAWYLPPIVFAGDYSYAPDVVQQIAEDAQRCLDDALRDATARGVKRVSAKLLTGQPWGAIADAAEGFDLVVIGTHGRTGLARVLLGSVAEQVVRHAKCPVLTVRPDGEPKPFTHVLCPTDFSPSSRRAMELATELVKPGGAGITLLHVLEVPVAYSGELKAPGMYRELDRRSTDLLESWAAELRTRVGVPITTRFRIGYAGAETLAVLDDDRTIDLVVVGSHGRTGLRRIVLGSVAEKIVRHALCPVLVARR